MSESLPTHRANTRFEIDDTEALRRLDELEPITHLARLYTRVKRGITLPDGSYETNGDHVVQLQLVALAYVSKYHPELDPGRLTIYLLLHDIIEAVVDDTPTFGVDEATLSVKDEREAAGMTVLADCFAEFPALMMYVHEYEGIVNDEAAAGKGIDKLMPGFSHADNEGADLKQMYGVESYEQIVKGSAATDARLEVYAAAFQDIIAMRYAMHRRVARVAFGSMGIGRLS